MDRNEKALTVKSCCDSPKSPDMAKILMGSAAILNELNAHADDLLRVVAGRNTSETPVPAADCMLQEAINLEEGLRVLRGKLIEVKQFLWDC